MHPIGKIDKSIYRCITANIITDEVVITDNQVKHIFERHPEDYETLIENLKVALNNPDYIIKDKHQNTGLVVKQLNTKTGYIQIVLRICTVEDESGYKNSVISCWKISKKRLENYLRNKEILYKKE